MKKALYITIITLLLTSALPPITKAETETTTTSHTVQICNTISNLDEFPDIIVVERTHGPKSNASKGTLVATEKCFGSNTDKQSILDIVYWTTNNFKLINLDNLEANHGTPLAFNIPFVGDTVSDNTHLIRQDIEYSIGTATDGTLSLYKSKVTSEYDNGQPNQIETIANPANVKKIIPVIDDSTATQTTATDNPFPTPAPVETPVQKNLWQKIMCVFGIGSNC